MTLKGRFSYQSDASHRVATPHPLAVVTADAGQQLTVTHAKRTGDKDHNVEHAVPDHFTK